MIQSRHILWGATWLFVLTEILFAVLLQVSVYSVLFSFLSVVLAALFCALLASRSKGYLFTQAALLCTVGADFLLVVCNPPVRLPAMLFFSAVQLFYAARLYIEEEPARRHAHLVCRAVASVVAVTATMLALKENTDALAVVSIFYYAQLLLNIVLAFLRFRRMPLLAVGFLPFAIP